ncbi:cyclic-phosphate processing receiver domain-containing protein [Paenibacillus xylanexedens]
MTDKINLYVDDLRDCPKSFVVARTQYEAIFILRGREEDFYVF